MDSARCALFWNGAETAENKQFVGAIFPIVCGLGLRLVRRDARVSRKFRSEEFCLYRTLQYIMANGYMSMIMLGLFEKDG
jgi:hypothetical protein